MANLTTETYFDRRVPDALMTALDGGGFAHSLAEYGRSGQYGLDLALRADPKKNDSRATLYVGTTKTLDLFYLPSKGFKLDVHSTWRRNPHWVQAWQRWHPNEYWARNWQAVERFVESSITTISNTKGTKNGGVSSFLKEGIVQAGVSRFGSGNPLIVDRECVVGYRDKATKQRIRTKISNDLRRALKGNEPKWFKPKFGASECDALAIDENGDLLAIEVKPDTAIAGDVVNAPVQAWLYSRQFQHWADEVNPDVAPRDVISGMYDQRRQLGLSVGPRNAKVNSRLTVHPVVAIRPGYTKEVRRRFKEVVEIIQASDVDSPAMRFFTVNLAGRLDQFDPHDIDSWAKP